MGKQYIPIFLDWMKVTEQLNNEERGRLINALVAYAADEDWEAQIEGNERFLFPAFREQVNRNNEISRIRSAARACADDDTCAGKKTLSNEWDQKREIVSTPNKMNKSQQNVIVTTKLPKEEEEEEKKEEEEENEKEKESLSPAPARGGTDADDCFTAFWNEYPKHVAKQDALKAWRKLRPDEALIDRMMTGLTSWKKSDEWTREGGRFIPHPVTWLNGHRWEDEVPPPARAAPFKLQVIAQDYEQRDYSTVQDEFMARQVAEVEKFLRENPE